MSQWKKKDAEKKRALAGGWPNGGHPTLSPGCVCAVETGAQQWSGQKRRERDLGSGKEEGECVAGEGGSGVRNKRELF